MANSTTTADELYKTPINWKGQRRIKRIVGIGVPVAAGVALLGWLGSKYMGGDVDETQVNVVREPAPVTLQLSEKEMPRASLELPKTAYPTKEIEGATTPKKHALDMSSHDAFMESFAAALESGERDVYMEGNVEGYKDYLRGFEGVRVTEIEPIETGGRWRQGYKVFYENGLSIVFSIFEVPKNQRTLSKPAKYVVNSLGPGT